MVKKRKSFTPHIVSIVIVIVVLFSLAVYVDNQNIAGEAKKGHGDDSVESNDEMDTVYVFTLDTEKWGLSHVNSYQQKKDITRSIKDYENLMLELMDEPSYSLVVELGKKTFTKKFSPYYFRIAEDFRSKEKRLVDISKLYSDKVSLRFTLDSSLPEGEIKLIVIDENGNEIAQNLYEVKKQGKGVILEALGKIKSSLLVEEPEDEPWVWREKEEVTVLGCDDLREVRKGWNVLGENRINVIFYGVGFERKGSWRTGRKTGKPTFTLGLTSIINFYGSGTNSGLFSEEPFKSNRHLFNFWYSDRMYNPLLNPGSAEIIKYDRPNLCLEIFDPLSITVSCPLSNIVPVYLINDEDCRSSAGVFDGLYGSPTSINLRYFVEKSRSTGDFINRQPLYNREVFTHEMGHSVGYLADEYTEDDAGDYPRLPNCLDGNQLNTALSLNWPRVSQGCSYDGDNINPSLNSIMGDSDIPNGFGEVNERHLCYRFSQLTGQQTCGSCGICRDFDVGYPCNEDYECTTEVCDDTCQPLNLPPESICLDSKQCPQDYACLEATTRRGFFRTKRCIRVGLQEFEECLVLEQCSTLNCQEVTPGLPKVCLRSRKEAGERCLIDSQCLSGKCEQGACSALRSWGQPCTSHNQCASGMCASTGSRRLCY